MVLAIFIVAMMALMCCGAAGAFYYQTNLFLKKADRTPGRVVDLIKKGKGENAYYYPVIEFKAEDGTMVKYTSPTGAYPAPYDIGEEINILYERSSPKNAKIDSFFNLHIMSVATGAVGAVMLLVVVVLLILL